MKGEFMNKSDYDKVKASVDTWPQWKKDAAERMMHPYVEAEPNYPDVVDGDIYWNPVFGDLWIVEGNSFRLINDTYSAGLDDAVGFIKVGHVDGLVRKK